jgi:TP901 family phage tail tape measure protein
VPLGVREVLLVVRAQNMGSGVIRNLAGDFNNLNGAAKKAAQQQMQTGSSLMAIGTAIGAVGAAGLVFLGKATSSAVEYNRQVALTKTQMYGVKASFDQVSEAGLDVARKIAVPLDQIQSGLYDIFSSMDVNLGQARYLLKNFSKEAVAGQVDLSTAERATIGVLNSYHMKVQDVVKVQDIMFNLVKYGVGTYGDFANVIGRVTPSAVRANQTFEQTAAIMAFLTRNGMSASNAASSAGRALDAIGKSRDKIAGIGATVEDALGTKTAHHLGFMHDSMIKIVDASGRLLPVNQIMTELGTRLKGLNPTQLNDVLNTMFKGTGGTIQAMRFFNVAIHNFDQLNGLTRDMYHNRGALQAAYNTMANTPAAKIQLLKNNFKAFMIVLGQQLLPIVGKVASALSTFFKFMGTLPKPLITVIAIIIGVTSVMLVLTGIVLAVVGAWMVFTAIMAATEIAIAPIALTIGLIIAAVVALAVAAYFIVKNWGPISKWFHDMWFDMWHWIDHILQMIRNTLGGAWDSLARITVEAWNKIFGGIKDAWDKITGIFSGVTSWISRNFDGWWKTHGDSIKQIWRTMWGGIVDDTKSYWNTVVSVTKAAWNIMKQIWDSIVYIFRAAWDIISGIFRVAWAEISFMVKTGMAGIELIFKVGWAIVVGIFRAAWALIQGGFKIFWALLKGLAKIGWAGITSVVKIAWDVIVGIFSIFIDILTGHWHTALVDMRNMAVQVWNAIKGFLTASWNAIKGAAVPIWNALKNEIVGVWHAIYDTTHSIWSNIIHYLHQVWDDMKSGARATVNGLGTIWHGIENIFKIPVNFVIGTVYDNGIRRLWNNVMNAIGLKKFDLPTVKTLAAGGKLPGFGGGDRIPALLEAGETVVDKNRSRKWAWVFEAMGVPGYAKGGRIGQDPPGRAFAAAGPAASIGGPGLGPLGGVLHLAGAVAKMMAAVATGNQTAFANALGGAIGHSGGGAGGELGSMIATLPMAMARKFISGLWSKVMSSGFASGNAIVDYAMKWVGKVPYVWGGTALPGGADCSGFVKAVYDQFHLNPPRTSEAQGAWVRRSGVVPGGLAFYHSPPGGPDPGHVAIIKDLNHVISQGGGMGPQVIGINALPLLWTGVPPGGLGALPASFEEARGSIQQMALIMLKQRGWGDQWPSFNSLETREASWNMLARNASSGAYGLAQFINGPSEYFQYGGSPFTAMGQLTGMLNYMGQRYPSGPNEAWRHELAFGWRLHATWIVWYSRRRRSRSGTCRTPRRYSHSWCHAAHYHLHAGD